MLTEEILSPYIGGQLQIRCTLGRHVYRGEIRAFKLEDHNGPDLIVEMAWNAQLEGGREFINLNRPRCYFKLNSCTDKIENEIITLRLPSGETATFHLPNDKTNIIQPSV